MEGQDMASRRGIDKELGMDKQKSVDPTKKRDEDNMSRIGRDKKAKIVAKKSTHEKSIFL